MTRLVLQVAIVLAVTGMQNCFPQHNSDTQLKLDHSNPEFIPIPGGSGTVGPIQTKPEPYALRYRREGPLIQTLPAQLPSQPRPHTPSQLPGQPRYRRQGPVFQTLPGQLPSQPRPENFPSQLPGQARTRRDTGILAVPIPQPVPEGEAILARPIPQPISSDPQQLRNRRTTETLAVPIPAPISPDTDAIKAVPIPQPINLREPEKQSPAAYTRDIPKAALY